MSRSPSPFSVQQKLNKISPGAAEAGLGDILNDLITAVSALQTAVVALTADHNTVVAKLNLDAGVTDVNYAVSTAVAQTAVVPLTSR